MEDMGSYFFIEYTRDRMQAELHCKQDLTKLPETIKEEDLLRFLNKNQIKHGIIRKHTKQFEVDLSTITFPILIAKGTDPKHGTDGTITYTVQTTEQVKEHDVWNFREVMQIPMVNKGDKLAVIALPKQGEQGIDIFGNPIPAKKGKPVLCRAGKNVIFNEDELTFYASASGQVSVANHTIHVHDVYEVHESLSMKIGNLNFNGSVIIHGDVPSGYSVKADGDIKIYGMVEAAEVVSGGSVYISEGMAGLKTGKIDAAVDVHIGYVNQGNIRCGRNLFVENSILHSDCKAKNTIYCQRGNIIGGQVNAEEKIEVNDLGNRMNTQTEIYLGNQNTSDQSLKTLLSERKQAEATVKQLEMIGQKIIRSKDQMNPEQLKLMLSRQQHSLKKTKQQIDDINQQIVEQAQLVDETIDREIIVRNNLYANTILIYGKYRHTVDKDQQHMKITWNNNEFNFQPL
ncbi:MAG TPA: FapA family protein [Cerasibacillus sp.]|uniref:DUF342 domain-containing protein n=1 Tax=Cerasibacillus sp. TaxID=2498711 RepID=UPI002F4148A5